MTADAGAGAASIPRGTIAATTAAVEARFPARASAAARAARPDSMAISDISHLTFTTYGSKQTPCHIQDIRLETQFPLDVTPSASIRDSHMRERTDVESV